MSENLNNWLLKLGIPENLSGYAIWLCMALATLLLAYLANYIAKKILLTGVRYFVKRTKTEWDDALLKRNVFARFSQLAPALVIYYGAFWFPETQTAIIQRLSMIYMLLAGLYGFSAFLNAADDIYLTFKVSKQRPIKGYLQLVRILASIFVGLITLATLMNQEVKWLLGGLGAMTAVMMLVFKDSILGLLASIQLSSNDMVRIGDWIEMPKYGADGDVIDVSLHTVKVQNWDKTITTIPSYSLISDSFRNWRGMSESGGRRIKRAVNIDMGSIRFCTPEMLNRFEKFQYLSEHIKYKRDEIAEYNRAQNIDTSQLINGRNLTNVGTFRAYVAAYLKNHPKIHQNMTFLLRQLPPGEYGLPIEIYVFSNDQEWANYEAIQADIFDHILAVIPMFDLRVFQNPSGNDFQSLRGALH